MSLSVLSSEVIRDLLENLSREEAEHFVDTLRSGLHQYSTGTDAVDKSVFHQPSRSAIHSEFTGATTLFMPAISSLGHSMKVITVPSPDFDPALPPIKPTGSLTLYAPDGSPVGFLHAQTLTAFRTALASSCLLLKRTRVKTLTVFGAGIQAYWHIRLALMLRGDTIETVNIINRQFSNNAREILTRFYQIPREVKEREGWEKAEFSMLTPGYGDYGRLQREHILAADVIYCCTPSTQELFDGEILTSYEGRKKGRLIAAIGSYTKDMRELPRDIMLQATKRHEGGRKHFHKHTTEGGVVVVDTLNGALKEAGEVVDAGLEPNQLIELGELVMINKLYDESEPVSRTSMDMDTLVESVDKVDIGSRTTLDSGSTAVGSTGSEPSKSPAHERTGSSSAPRPSSPNGGGGSGGFLSAIRPWKHRRTKSQQSVSGDKHEKEPRKHDEHLSSWLSTGNVIYKSVGLGLMDLIVGLEVVKLAQRKEKGARVDNFSA
ncbi:putative proline utilization protein PrnX-like protein [Xylariaceae sp. FL0594]|nr:putative proline utilization protein PrnX-like protein [Xylariaceae sp. FL0594]